MACLVWQKKKLFVKKLITRVGKGWSQSLTQNRRPHLSITRVLKSHNLFEKTASDSKNLNTTADFIYKGQLCLHVENWCTWFSRFCNLTHKTNMVQISKFCILYVWLIMQNMNTVCDYCRLHQAVVIPLIKGKVQMYTIGYYYSKQIIT